MTLGRSPWRQLAAEQRLYWRNCPAAFFTFLLPIVLLVFVGRSARDATVDGEPYPDFFVPGMLAHGGRPHDVRRARDHAGDPPRERRPQARARHAAAAGAVPRRAGGSWRSCWRGGGRGPRGRSARLRRAGAGPPLELARAAWSSARSASPPLGVALLPLRAERRGLVGRRQRRLPADAVLSGAFFPIDQLPARPAASWPTRCRSRTCSRRCAPPYDGGGARRTTAGAASSWRCGALAASWSPCAPSAGNRMGEPSVASRDAAR